ncbi:TPA: replication factor C small subunit [Candidatus Micrarchaeota archaeon]|nr:replication factor C small subunit [Candidatus Micrarchaeota archaeon]
MVKGVFEPWVEKYRPRKIKDIAGNKHVFERLENFAKTKNLPNLLFAGRAGVGKTTAALALADELYGEDRQQSFIELNASDERGIDVVRGKIKDFARTLPLSGVDFKLILLDEADSLTSDAQQALRRTMEAYARNCRFILSCNYSSSIIEPIQSRCAVFRFRSLEDGDLKKIVQDIAKKEGLDVDDKALDAIAYISEGDARKAINCLQGSAEKGKITEEKVFEVSSRARPKEIAEMVELALKGKFIEARNKLNTVMVKYAMSGEDVLQQVYREVIALGVSDEVKVQLVDRVGEYDFRLSEGADERIQLEALLAQIMLVGSKKA